MKAHDGLPAAPSDQEAADLASAPVARRRRQPAYVILSIAVCLVSAAATLGFASQAAMSAVRIPSPTLAWTQETTIAADDLVGVHALAISNDWAVNVRVDPRAKDVTIVRHATHAWSTEDEPLNYVIGAGELSFDGACETTKAGFVGCSATLDVTVPPVITTMGARITTNLAEVDVAGVAGDLVVQGAGKLTVSGAGGNATLEAERASVSDIGGVLKLQALESVSIAGVAGDATIEAGSISASGLNGTRAVLSGGDGGVQVSASRAMVTIDGYGDVLLNQPAPGSKATSGSGSVLVVAPRGSIQAETVDGAISIESAPGDVDARTEHGAITVTAAAGSPAARVEALSDDSEAVTVTAPQDPTSSRQVTLRSTDGSIEYLQTR